MSLSWLEADPLPQGGSVDGVPTPFPIHLPGQRLAQAELTLEAGGEWGEKEGEGEKAGSWLTGRQCREEEELPGVASMVA